MCPSLESFDFWEDSHQVIEPITPKHHGEESGGILLSRAHLLHHVLAILIIDRPRILKASQKLLAQKSSSGLPNPFNSPDPIAPGTLCLSL